jgi:hypothetical protein
MSSKKTTSVKKIEKSEKMSKAELVINEFLGNNESENIIQTVEVKPKKVIKEKVIKEKKVDKVEKLVENEQPNPEAECNFCFEKYNNSARRKKVKCNDCDYHACVDCLCKNWLLTTPEPVCPNCRHVWSNKFLLENISLSFIQNELNPHHAKKYVEIDRAKLAETALTENKKILANKINVFIDDFTKDKKSIHAKCNDFITIISEYNNKCSANHKPMLMDENEINKLKQIFNELNEQLNTVCNKINTLVSNYVLSINENANPAWILEPNQWGNNKAPILGMMNNLEKDNILTNIINNINKSKEYCDENYKERHRLITNILHKFYHDIYLISLPDKHYTYDAERIFGEIDTICNSKLINNTNNGLLQTNNVNNELLARTKAKEMKSVLYGKKCTMNDCRGFLQNNNSCSECSHFVCNDCLMCIGVVNKEDENRNTIEKIKKMHNCDPDIVETIKLLKKETKGCPQCDIPIYKIDGCDQMWCTQCKVAFSWKTGLIVKSNDYIHNPHYFEWMRKNNREIARNPLDILGVQNNECERMTVHRLLVELQNRIQLCNVICVPSNYNRKEIIRFIPMDIPMDKSEELRNKLIKIYKMGKYSFKNSAILDEQVVFDVRKCINEANTIKRYCNHELGSIYYIGDIIKIKEKEKLHLLFNLMDDGFVRLNSYKNVKLRYCNDEDRLLQNRIKYLSGLITDKQYKTNCFTIIQQSMSDFEIGNTLNTFIMIVMDMYQELLTLVTNAQNEISRQISKSTARIQYEIISCEKKHKLYINDLNNNIIKYDLMNELSNIIEMGDEYESESSIQELITFNNDFDEIEKKHRELLDNYIVKMYEELEELINITNELLFIIPKQFGITNSYIMISYKGHDIEFKTLTNLCVYIQKQNDVIICTDDINEYMKSINAINSRVENMTMYSKMNCTKKSNKGICRHYVLNESCCNMNNNQWFTINGRDISFKNHFKNVNEKLIKENKYNLLNNNNKWREYASKDVCECFQRTNQEM